MCHRRPHTLNSRPGLNARIAGASDDHRCTARMLAGASGWSNRLRPWSLEPGHTEPLRGRGPPRLDARTQVFPAGVPTTGHSTFKPVVKQDNKGSAMTTLSRRVRPLRAEDRIVPQ